MARRFHEKNLMQKILEKIKKHWVIILVIGLFACAGFAANVKTIFLQDRIKKIASSETYNINRLPMPKLKRDGGSPY